MSRSYISHRAAFFAASIISSIEIFEVRVEDIADPVKNGLLYQDARKDKPSAFPASIVLDSSAAREAFLAEIFSRKGWNVDVMAIGDICRVTVAKIRFPSEEAPVAAAPVEESPAKTGKKKA